MSVAHAYCIGRPTFLDIVHVRVLLARSVGAGVVPEDNIEPFAAGDVVSSMTQTPEMHHATSLLVLVGAATLSMILRAHKATELQTSSIKIKPQASIEGHIAVVGVHVKSKVLSFAVPHDEAVVPIPDATSARKEYVPDWLQHLLEMGDEGLEADLVQNDSIVVHAVWSSGFKATIVEIENLCQELIAELQREDGKRKHLARQSFGEKTAPSLWCACLICRPEGWIKPPLAHCGWKLEELFMQGHRRVSFDGFNATQTLHFMHLYALDVPRWHSRPVQRKSFKWIYQEQVDRRNDNT